ncbi:hypothetical protein NDU88_003925 [Pleurodeles waltl]|uniref:Uncharacterized protein n=1 Tax=Pleurodeles waltl TaxID=8319 RepID=A0AAV7MTX6_PLEWA|nr:hypothetical protein NDU88_003925 [Pleurodeles waltl]
MERTRDSCQYRVYGAWPSRQWSRARSPELLLSTPTGRGNYPGRGSKPATQACPWTPTGHGKPAEQANKGPRSKGEEGRGALKATAHENSATRQKNSLLIGAWEEDRIREAGPDTPEAAASQDQRGSGHLRGEARPREDSTGRSPGTATWRLEMGSNTA